MHGKQRIQSGNDEKKKLKNPLCGGIMVGFFKPVTLCIYEGLLWESTTLLILLP